MHAASAIHLGGLAGQNYSLSSLCTKHSWRCTRTIAPDLPQGVGAAGGAIGRSQVAEAIFAPGNCSAGAGITDTHIAQTVFAIGGAFAAAHIAERVFAPGGTTLRVPDVAETVLAQGAALAIVTLVASITEAVFAVGTVGSLHCLKQ